MTFAGPVWSRQQIRTPQLAMSALRIDNDPGCREESWIVDVRVLAV
jgi:hypothetical protein